MEPRLGSDEAAVPDVRLDDHGSKGVAASLEQRFDGRPVVERQRHGEAGKGGRYARTVGEPERCDAAPRLHQKAVGVAVVAAIALEDRVAVRRWPPGTS